MSQWPSGITDAQQDLICLIKPWSDTFGGRGLCRKAFDPGQVRRHLANLSVMEHDGDQGFRFRFVGSAVMARLGLKRRPESVDDLPIQIAEAWYRRANHILSAPGVICGSDDLTTRGLRHDWLRASLLAANGQVHQILCHDLIAPLGADVSDEAIPSDIHGNEIVLAA